MAQANIKAVISAEDRASGVLVGFSDRVDALGARVGASLKIAATAFTTAAIAATGFAVKSAANFEQTRIGLENMLGSADKARGVLKEVSKFAAETPFEFPELAQATRQLIAFGFSAEDGVKTMKQLGDVSAAVGAPINDLAYLMGTLKAQGRAFTIDIRQFAQRGIPIYEYLAKVLKTNTQALTGMIEEGKIGFPEVQKAFEMMTAEGGKFHGTMEKQSKSLSGLFSTLKDNIGQAAREMVGITVEGDIKEGSMFARLRDAVNGLNQNLPRMIASMQQIIRDIIPQLKLWANNIVEVGRQVAEYLEPKLEALWNSIKNAMPTLQQLWREVLQPLSVVIGQTLVLALGLAIDAINVLVRVLMPVTQWMLDNKPIVIGLAIAFGTLAFAMNFENIAASFGAAMAAVRGTIIATQTQLGLLNAALLSFGGFTVFAGVAIGALAAVQMKGQETLNLLQRLNDQAAQSQNSATQAMQEVANAYHAGRITKEQYQDFFRKISGARAEGGPVNANSAYLVGEKGPEIFVPKQGGTVVPNRNISTGMASNTVLNLSVNVGVYTGSEIEKRKLAKEMWQSLQDLASAKGKSAQELLGI
jgi:gas vesicle protein